MKKKFGLMWRIGLALVLALSLSLVMAVPAGAQTVGTISLDQDWYKTSDTVMVTIEDADLDELLTATQDESSDVPDDTRTAFHFSYTNIDFDSVSKPYDMIGSEYFVASVNGALGRITVTTAPPSEVELMALTAYAALPGAIVQPTKATLLTVFLDATPAAATSVTITVTGTTTEVGVGDTEDVLIDATGPSTATAKHFSLITNVQKTAEVGVHLTTEAGIKVDNLVFADYTYYGVETFEGSVVSSVDALGVTPEMTETGPRTGIFEGSLVLAAATNDTAVPPELKVVDHGTITAVYVDADPAATRTALATVDDTAPSLVNESPAAGAKINDSTPVISVAVLDFESGVKDTPPLGMEITGPGAVSPVQTAITDGYHLLYHVGTGEALSEGTITVTITGEDVVGNLISPNFWTFDLDLTAPTMASAATATTTTIEVTFSEGLDANTVIPGDFLVGGMLTPTEATVDVAVVTLTVPEMATDATPTVELVGAVSDIADNEQTLGEVTASDELGPAVDIAVSPDPAGAETATFNLTFSENMKVGVAPTVSFTDTAGSNSVTGGWIGTNTWQGTFDISGLGPQEFESVVTVTAGQDLADNVMAQATGSFNIDTEVAAPTFYPADVATIYTASPIVRITFSEVVTITAATFDGADVSANLTTTDFMVYRLATEGLTEGAHTIMVSAEDELGNIITDASATFIVSVSQTITLYEGWNLISLPLIPDDPAIGVVISNSTLISGDVINVGIIRSYDPATGEFPYYMPATGSGDLTEMRDGYGFWVFMNAADTLTVAGRVMPVPPEVPPSYDVVVGWNLIGFKSTEDMIDYTAPPEEEGYLINIAGTYPVLWSYDAQAGVYSNVKGEPTGMKVGHGFWLWVTEMGTIVPPA